MFRIEDADGKRRTVTATMVEYGTEKASAMAKTVGVPCAVTTQMLLDGKITLKGVVAPMSRDVVYPLMEELEKEGITMIEAEY